MTTRIILNGGSQNWRLAPEISLERARQIVRTAMTERQVVEIPVQISGATVSMFVNGGALATAIVVELPDTEPDNLT